MSFQKPYKKGTKGVRLLDTVKKDISDAGDSILYTQWTGMEEEVWWWKPIKYLDCQYTIV